MQRRLWIAALVLMGILFVAPPAAAVDQWTAGNVWWSETSEEEGGAGSSYGYALFSDYGILLTQSDTVAGTNSGTSAEYDIEVGRSYEKVGNPADLTISMDLDAYVSIPRLVGASSHPVTPLHEGSLSRTTWDTASP